jgi:hypothetical protein
VFPGSTVERLVAERGVRFSYVQQHYVDARLHSPRTLQFFPRCSPIRIRNGSTCSTRQPRNRAAPGPSLNRRRPGPSGSLDPGERTKRRTAPENQTADVVREHPESVLWNTGGMYRVQLYAEVGRSVVVEELASLPENILSRLQQLRVQGVRTADQHLPGRHLECHRQNRTLSGSPCMHG